VTQQIPLKGLCEMPEKEDNDAFQQNNPEFTMNNTNSPLDDVDRTQLEETTPIKYVRTRLLQGCRLLELLSDLITVKTPAMAGPSIVVAAPHHARGGTPLSDGHDVNTGYLAELLAEKLNAKCIVVDELRTFVDINKNQIAPAQLADGDHPGRKAFKEVDKRLKLFYQSQVFADNPNCIIEIHGHRTGVFDYEVSTGFKLDKKVKQDRSLIAALGGFKTVLINKLKASNLLNGDAMQIGVYPLDPQVKFVASGTQTFNKIEKLREMGLNIAGLHIEILERYRPNPNNDVNRKLYDAMAECIKDAVINFIHALGKPVEFEFKDYLFNGFFFGSKKLERLTGSAYQVQQVPRELLGKNLAVFSIKELRQLGLEDGDRIVLSRRPDLSDVVEFEITSSRAIRNGYVGIAKKYRDLLNTQHSERVYIGKKARLDINNMSLGYITKISEEKSGQRIAVGSQIFKEIDRQGNLNASFNLHSAHSQKNDVHVELAQGSIHNRSISIPETIADQLNVTYGDLICLTFNRAYESDKIKFTA
jgi:hypothetical protein